MARPASSNDPLLPQIRTPDGLSALARRLRAYADNVIAHSHPQQQADLVAGADLADGIAKLLRDIHSGTQDDVIAAILSHFGEA